MKWMICALVGAGLLLTAGPTWALPGFRPVSPRSLEQHSYEQGRSLALELIRRARPTLSRVDARLADAAVSRLERATFLASSNRASGTTCARGSYSLFVNPREPGRIFVCDEVRPHARVGGADAVAILAQGFVHESAHLAGERDECAATRFELAVMDRTIGRRSAGSRIRYGAQCGR